MKKTTGAKRYLSLLLTVVLLFAAAVFLRGAVIAEDEEPALPDNGIPVIYVNVDESQGTIEDMLTSPDHSAYCYGTLTIDVPEGFHYSDFPDTACLSLENLAMSIRGRGNSTWMKSEKKPFKIKLDKKTDVFGLGKNKHWVLVANDFDPSLIKDRITAWLGDAFGFEFTPRGVPVDLVLSGEQYGTQYLGSYYFSENVRVDDNRLEIEELEETDVDEAKITGGYLLQDALQVRQGSPDRFFTKRGVDWATHTPSFDTEADSVSEEPEELLGGTLLEENFAGNDLGDAYENHAQQTYIQNHIQKIEDALFSDGTDYRELMDVESAAKYWLVNALSLNADGYVTGSTYIYKRRDVDGVVSKLYWGPLWDFDYAWNNKPVTSGFEVKHEWLKPMFCDRDEGGFVQEIKKQWPALREAALQLVADGGIIDQYYEETKASAAQDYIINHADDPAFSDYKTAVDELKNWIIARIAWIDENLDLLDNLAHKIRMIVDDELHAVDFVLNNKSFETLGDYQPEKEGYVFIGWTDENGEYVDELTSITRDMELTAQFVSEEEATHATDIAFRKDNDIVQLNFWSRSYVIDYCVVPADALDQAVEWSSSDESYATVDENGMITYSGPGEVTITAKLKYGKTRTFTLTVIDEEVPVPESVYPDEEVIRMNVDDQTPVYISTVPSPAKINSYEYTSEDESIVTVDEYGILKAAGPGETRIRVLAVNGFYGDDRLEFETYVTVIVSEESIEPTPEPVVIDYEAVNGEGADGSNYTWKKGSKQGIEIIIKRSAEDETCFSHFQDVKIDGYLLKKGSGYTAKQGSTIINILPNALESLKEGEHKVTVTFDDGEAEAVVKIAGSGKPSAPDTSDHRNSIWFPLLAGALIVFALALRMRVKAH